MTATSCPNALPARGDGHCSGTGLRTLTMPCWTADGCLRYADVTVPCGSCWVAAGYEPLPPQHGSLLARWLTALGQVTDEAAGAARQLTLDEATAADNAPGRAFDRVCDQLRAAGVPDRIRDAWHLWVSTRTGQEVST